jgi:hypothetical protein
VVFAGARRRLCSAALADAELYHRQMSRQRGGEEPQVGRQEGRVQASSKHQASIKRAEKSPADGLFRLFWSFLAALFLWPDGAFYGVPAGSYA